MDEQKEKRPIKTENGQARDQQWEEELQVDLDAFQIYLQKMGIAQNTIVSYQSAVRQYYLHYPLLTIENLQAYKRYLIEHYSANTVNAKIYGLNKYLRYRNTIQDGPDLSLDKYNVPTVKRQQKTFADNVISNEDYKLLKKRLNVDGQLCWYFIVRFLGATGARVSELVQIKVEHLKLGYMDLYSKGGKIRRIYFPDSLCEEGLKWLADKQVTSGFIFLNRRGQQITPRGINSQLKKFAEQYGIDPSTIYPHSFRHLYAKNFLMKFNDISLLADLLGHESIETTKIYLTQTSTEQKALIDRIIVW